MLNGKLVNSKYIIWIILLASFIFKLIYAYNVKYNISPHDLGDIITSYEDIKCGHLGYIQFLSHYRRFPSSYTEQFYQPPLFHIIAAVLYGISVNIFNANYSQAFENIQMMNMLFACITIIFSVMIIEKMITEPIYKIITTLIIAFSPVFYIIGTEINGDCLMTMFAMIAIYATLLWNENNQISNIILIAFTLSLAILAKSSAVLLSPAIGLVFIINFIYGSSNRKRLLKQYLLFLLICAILAPLWLIRNKMKFDIPFSYVPCLGEDSWQYIGNYSLIKRFGLPSRVQLMSLLINDVNYITRDEYVNIWRTTLLTENFDEGILEFSNVFFIKIGVLLLRTTLVLHIIEVASIIYIATQIAKVDYKEKAKYLLVIITILSLIFSYLKFAYEYPHICTMNARYIVVALIMCIIAFGVCQDRMNKFKRYKNIRLTFNLILSLLIALSSSILYLLCYGAE